ncbi:uncharacterized protein LOC102352735 isoform X2 [Latimeria chalumnae]|uniref:uncharacterized protein LOC102352735 isoform X2 n=1 Tax=Latimeria chalumnae TaxID=7897 RepID=UPI00313B8BD3
MTCCITPFEEEASSVTMKKIQGVPLLTIGSKEVFLWIFCWEMTKVVTNSRNTKAVCCTAGLTAGLIKGAFMVCERISVCLGRKLFDPQRSRTACRYKLEGISPLAEENADSALTNTEQRKQLCRNGSEASQEQTEGLYKHSRRRI